MRPPAKDTRAAQMDFKNEAESAFRLARAGLYPFETGHVGVLPAHPSIRPADCCSQLDECTKKRHLLSETVRSLTMDPNELKKVIKETTGGGRRKRSKKKRTYRKWRGGPIKRRTYKKKRTKKKRSKK